jgi:hypothetical protein
MIDSLIARLRAVTSAKLGQYPFNPLTGELSRVLQLLDECVGL